jgi:class 3 adenylate cyclase
VKFRAKIFLSVLLPACALVAAAAGSAITSISARAEEQAREELLRSHTALSGVLREQLGQLRTLGAPFSGPRFDAAISEAVDSGDVAAVRESIEFQFGALKIDPDLYEVRSLSGKVLLSQARGGAPPGPLQPWIKDRPAALTEFGGEPYLALRFEHEKGWFVFGKALKPVLEGLSRDFAVGIALVRGASAGFSTLAGWTPASGTEGEVRVEGRRFLAEGRRPEDSEYTSVVLLKSMESVDAQRRSVLFSGGAALLAALLVAALVSAGVSRGVSRPVEELVNAAHRIAKGDYSLKVKVEGEDEIGRLGEAFNEMTVDLRKRQEIMEKTLSRDVAEEFMKGTERGNGERRVISIIFMDIRGYTSGTEGMDPEDVMDLLNELMDLLATAIERHGGIVNKFLGDGLMAMFGAPKPIEDHACRAVQAAVEMQKWMERWNQRRTVRGLSSFYSGIGINTGVAVCGKVGARDRLEYTILGEEVNLASRICGKAAPRQVLITKQTWEHVKDFVKTRALEPVTVKGLSYPIMVYEVLE